MNNIEVYEGSPVTFDNKDGRMMVNATQMSKCFGKLPAHWLSNNSTKEFLEELESAIGIPISQLVIVRQGNSSEFEQGTWRIQEFCLTLHQQHRNSPMLNFKTSFK